MKKEDLKTGMVVTHRNGVKSVVMRSWGGLSGLLVDLEDGCQISFTSIEEDFTTKFCSDCDIMKVEAYSNLAFLFRDVFEKSMKKSNLFVQPPKIIWERESSEKIKLKQVVEDLQKQLADAQEKLKNFK